MVCGVSTVISSVNHVRGSPRGGVAVGRRDGACSARVYTDCRRSSGFSSKDDRSRPVEFGKRDKILSYNLM